MYELPRDGLVLGDQPVDGYYCLEGGGPYEGFSGGGYLPDGRAVRFYPVRTCTGTAQKSRPTPAIYTLHTRLRKTLCRMFGSVRGFFAGGNGNAHHISEKRPMAHNAYTVTCGLKPKVTVTHLRGKTESRHSGCHGWRNSGNGCIICELRHRPSSGQKLNGDEDMAERRLIQTTAEILRQELITRPLINERVMRYLNEENQLRLARHISTTATIGLYQAKIIPTPWGATLDRYEALEYVIAIIESEKGDSVMLQEVEWILRHMFDTMCKLRSTVPPKKQREEFWTEVRKRWYRERGL